MKPFICNNEQCKDQALFFSGKETKEDKVSVSHPNGKVRLAAKTSLPEIGEPTCPNCSKSHRVTRGVVIHLLVPATDGYIKSRFHEQPFKFGCSKAAQLHKQGNGPARYTHVRSAVSCWECLKNNPPIPEDNDE